MIAAIVATMQDSAMMAAATVAVGAIEAVATEDAAVTVGVPASKAVVAALPGRPAGQVLVRVGATVTTIHRDRAAAVARIGRTRPDRAVVPERHPTGAGAGATATTIRRDRAVALAPIGRTGLVRREVR